MISGQIKWLPVNTRCTTVVSLNSLKALLPHPLQTLLPCLSVPALLSSHNSEWEGVQPRELQQPPIYPAAALKEREISARMSACVSSLITADERGREEAGDWGAHGFRWTCSTWRAPHRYSPDKMSNSSTEISYVGNSTVVGRNIALRKYQRRWSRTDPVVSCQHLFADFAPDKRPLPLMTHTTDERTMMYAAYEERQRLSAGRRDPQQTHSVTHSHTDTQGEQSHEEKRRVWRGGGGKLWESLCIERSLLFSMLQQTCQSATHSHLTQSVAAGERQWKARRLTA